MARLLLAAAALSAAAAPTPGGDEAAPRPPAEAPASTEGILPLPDYGGDLDSRAFLAGDLGGSRTDLASHGIQFLVDWNQVVQSVVDGGREHGTRYGGSLDYQLKLDLYRMGVLPGALVSMRAESRYGEAANDIAGPLLPVNVDGLMPLTDQLDDDIAITVTSLNYAQFLSEHLGLVFGKLDTLDGDPNEFAGGRGVSQFLNSNFVLNPSVLLTVPYSTVGGGVIFMPWKNVTISSLVFNTTDSSTTTGFDDIGDGWTSSTEVNTQYRLGHLPGGQNVGFVYAWDNEFAELGSGRFVFDRGEGLSFETDAADDTWALYWSIWQYLFVEDPGDQLVDLLNGQPDQQGVGPFARVGFADEDTNPIDWFAGGGVGGRGLIPGRDDDTFGAGYFYTRLQETRIGDIAGVDDQSRGVETFYNIALTPACHLTLDVQVVDAPLPGVDRAVILGARLSVRF